MSASITIEYSVPVVIHSVILEYEDIQFELEEQEGFGINVFLDKDSIISVLEQEGYTITKN